MKSMDTTPSARSLGWKATSSPPQRCHRCLERYAPHTCWPIGRASMTDHKEALLSFNSIIPVPLKFQDAPCMLPCTATSTVGGQNKS